MIEPAVEIDPQGGYPGYTGETLSGCGTGSWMGPKFPNPRGFFFT